MDRFIQQQVFFLSIQMLAEIRGISYKAAQVEHRAIRDALGGKDKKQLTIREYARYTQVCFEELCPYLQGLRPYFRVPFPPES